ncbi:hypothetical protein [Alysiella filiformis]|uniref:Uncharacterized protein n=1 Tax=Alysiella filiformis DSM 16848 TaxID=1120981 RepID=A0A286E3J7_9NEIS|nr:hypothetical protein [Alysiella filiformis]QMT31080.1 hypothetical protein H3L97_10215 [Alysiella filiformis]UBQ55929.1 hypothetical protein JF568_10255 [Alysiella filiformis DSM 16848]SOD65476.1 hypothetical protein SAMN02746062_00305 [Alysiella filiformis DSM 16848]
MLEPTHSRQTATVQTWDGKIGTAQAEDDGIYEIAIETMDYAPVQVGDKIEIFWFDGKMESWRIMPKVAQTETLDYETLSQISGRKFFVQRSQILLRELYLFVLLLVLFGLIKLMWAEFTWFGIMGYVCARAIDLSFLFFLGKTWSWTENDDALVVSEYANVKQGNAYLKWQDIASAEIRKTPLFRLKYLHIAPKPNIKQPEIKLALFLLDKQAQNETVHIIQKRIQAA